MTGKSNKDIIRRTIGGLFESNDIFRIPLYQRNFSWGESEITQLIRDIADFASKKEEQDYYFWWYILMVPRV